MADGSGGTASGAAQAAEGTLGVAVALRRADALGFRLAGAAVREVERGEEASAFRSLLADPRLGVVAVEEDVLQAVPPHVVRRARQRGVPVVLSFALPRRWGEAGRGEAYVAAILRRAVGYAVKLGGAGRGGTP
jgi:V/A-type H+/Na+-transporting ATPase subunit F